jgi:hypothetical protein
MHVVVYIFIHVFCISSILCVFFFWNWSLNAGLQMSHCLYHSPFIDAFVETMTCELFSLLLLAEQSPCSSA